MEDILKKIEGREWDWFNTEEGLMRCPNGNSIQIDVCLYSLADLLANKSWCKAVWGEDAHSHSDNVGSRDCPYDCEVVAWQRLGTNAFSRLQLLGQEACIKFIKETMA